MRYTTSPLTSSPILLLQDEKLRERLKDLFAYIPAISKKGSGTFERKRLDVFLFFVQKIFVFVQKQNELSALPYRHVIGSSVNCRRFSISSHRMSLETIFFITSRSEK